jgi:protein ImuB
LIRSPEAEDRVTQGAPLAVFPLALKSRRLLEKLGIRTLKALSTLAEADLVPRFGPEFLQDLRQLEVLTTLPLQNEEEAPPLTLSARLEAPALDHGRLFPVLEVLLSQAFDLLAPRGRLLAELRLVFVLESGAVITEVLRPAQPTAHRPTLVRLADFRLSRQDFPEPVAELRIGVSDVKAPPSTGELFAPPVVRDELRGAEALALIRAQWGNDAVVRPVLVDHYAPELSYRWESVDGLTPSTPAGAASGSSAVRRVFWSGPTHENPSGQRLSGPLVLQVTAVEPTPPIDREYWFLRDRRGEVVWVSRDRHTGQPSLEGWVD